VACVAVAGERCLEVGHGRTQNILARVENAGDGSIEFLADLLVLTSEVEEGNAHQMASRSTGTPRRAIETVAASSVRTMLAPMAPEARGVELPRMHSARWAISVERA
jgi:hypothetical protein